MDYKCILHFRLRTRTEWKATRSTLVVDRALKLHHNLTNGHLSQTIINSVEKFVFFVGYGRSGHSIIASMMDAHPNMIIAHEFYLFDKWAKKVQSVRKKSSLFDNLYRNSYDSALQGWRTVQKDQKGYSLELGGTWQGKFDQLKVIGDKTAGDTAIRCHTSPEKFREMYQGLQDTVGIPIQVLHVVRNPYDMIATIALYNASHKHEVKIEASEDHKFNSSVHLSNAAASIFAKADGVVKMISVCHLDFLEIHIEDLIRDPKVVIQRICYFLELECSEEYLQKCYDKTFKTLSRSRDLVVWTPGLLARVQREKEKYPFFQRYSFSDDH